MAEGRTQGSKTGTTATEQNGVKRGAVGVLSGAQDAAEIVRATAERAAERWPEAVAGAQTAARDTQKALEKMPNQGLVIGTSFSLGLGVGLFMSGANRLLVVLAMAPAAAMAATLLARDEDSSSAS
jgi:pantoate kinase